MLVPPAVVPMAHSKPVMLLWASAKMPAQLALMVVVEVWKSMSAPSPSLGTPVTVGPVVSTVTPSDVAVLLVPAPLVARTVTK